MTAKYVVKGGLGGMDGTSEASAWPLEDSFANAVADDTVWIKYSSTPYYVTSDAAGILAAGGSLAGNTHIRYKGYYETTGDMDWGGSKYQSAVDVLQKGWNNSAINESFVHIYESNDLSKIVSLDAKNNIHFNNILFSGSSVGTTTCLYCNEPFGLEIEHCAFLGPITYGMRTVEGSNTLGSRLNDCFFSGFTRALRNFRVGYISNNVFLDSTEGLYLDSTYSTIVENNLFINLAIGMYRCEGVHVNHNLFYNISTACISNDLLTKGLIYQHSNIFHVAAIDDYAILLGDAGANGYASLSQHEYSLAYTPAGNFSANRPYYDDYQNEELPGTNNIVNQNPMFVCEELFDFRLHPNSPCIGAGKPDIHGNSTNIGPDLLKL